MASLASVTAEAAPALQLTREDGFFEFDREACKALGAKLHDQYVLASPFPHIVIDNFLDPVVLRRIVDEFPRREKGRFSDAYSQLKTGYTHGQIRSAYAQDLLNVLNSAPFLMFLQNLTGIRGLVSDAHYTGGGLHETARGGHLAIHADFNIHPHSKLQRRLNLILFLNDDWDESWGGSLELWDQDMKACRESVAPTMARAVVFNTDSNSYHGHPDPLVCPPEVMRRSIALYYYTLPTSALIVPHTTRFQARPGTNDKAPSSFTVLWESAKRVVSGLRRRAE